ncbi:DNA recombination protein RmuC homolog (fragment) [Tenacibaculum maritimum]
MNELIIYLLIAISGGIIGLISGRLLAKLKFEQEKVVLQERNILLNQIQKKRRVNN